MSKLSAGRSLEQVAYGMGIPFATARSIHTQEWGQEKKIITPLVNQRYRFLLDELNQTKYWYQRSWNKINVQFFQSVASITNVQWEYSKYHCVVSAFHKGISSWTGNIIARIWSENPFSMRKITAHELIIAHIFSMFRRNGKLNIYPLSHTQIWEIAEIAAWCMTGLDKKLTRFWPWLSESQLFSTHHNYPQLVKKQVKLGKVYQKVGFHGFLINALKLVESD